MVNKLASRPPSSYVGDAVTASVAFTAVPTGRPDGVFSGTSSGLSVRSVCSLNAGGALSSLLVLTVATRDHALVPSSFLARTCTE